MARPLRVEYPGALYHVMCRGNRGGLVFGEELDARLFLQTLGEGAERAGFLVHAYVLMSTHYHLLLETPEGNLVESMKWVQGTFTQRFNVGHGTWGHLFAGRYKAKVIEGVDPSYFRRVAMYIHLNPAAAGLVGRAGKALRSYGWSSLPFHVGRPSQRPQWLVSTRVLGCEEVRDTPSGRKLYLALAESKAREAAAVRKDEDESKARAGMERGWYHGSKLFRDQMLEHLEQDGGVATRRADDGLQQRERSEHAAEGFVRGCLALMGLKDRDLEMLRKGDERKLMIAGLLRQHFPVRATWVCGRLRMGHRSRVSEGLRLVRTPPQHLQSTVHALRSIL